MPNAPAASRGKNKNHTSVVTTGPPGSPGIPARGGVTAYFRALPGDRAFLSPSPALLLANLTPASRRQDHTTSPSAGTRPRQKRRPRPPHPAPTSVTIAKRPLKRHGMAEDMDVICGRDQEHEPRQIGTTGKSGSARERERDAGVKRNCRRGQSTRRAQQRKAYSAIFVLWSADYALATEGYLRP